MGPRGDREAGAIMRPKKRVLLVDGDEKRVSLRKFMLATRGFAVTAVSDGDAALEASYARPFDAVVVDLKIGQRDKGLVADIKAIYPSTSIILMSATVHAGTIAHQADRFIGKGQYDPYVFLEAIRGMTARKRGPRKIQPKLVSELPREERVA